MLPLLGLPTSGLLDELPDELQRLLLRLLTAEDCRAVGLLCQTSADLRRLCQDDSTFRRLCEARGWSDDGTPEGPRKWADTYARRCTFPARVRQLHRLTGHTARITANDQNQRSCMLIASCRSLSTSLHMHSE